MYEENVIMILRSIKEDLNKRSKIHSILKQEETILIRCQLHTKVTHKI